MDLGKTLLALSLLSLAGCEPNASSIELEPCSPAAADVDVAVTGVYRYQSQVLGLSGTITFAREGNRVSVLETTYDGEDARSLVGAGDLVGNRLDMTLTPANGDTDYSADVSLIFDDGGASFCLAQFSDTNDDVGGEGTYRGSQQP
jgi:hypothetical protein